MIWFLFSKKKTRCFNNNLRLDLTDILYRRTSRQANRQFDRFKSHWLFVDISIQTRPYVSINFPNRFIRFSIDLLFHAIKSIKIVINMQIHWKAWHFCSIFEMFTKLKPSYCIPNQYQSKWEIQLITIFFCNNSSKYILMKVKGANFMQ